jgi:photosystem II stability/assembly factor-like uncharacterized protein
LKNISQKALRLAVSAFLLFCAPPVFAQTWERLGPDGGDVISLAAGPEGAVYLGTADGHIFASSFFLPPAVAWQIRGRVGGRLDGVIQQLLVDAANPKRLFAAVWFQDPAAGGGVYRSDDAGRTWVLTGLRGEAVRALVQSPSNPELFLAGTRTGVFGSNDRGATWERISPAGDEELKNIDSLAVDPTDPRTIYAGTYHLPWKTTDAGKTWAPIATGMIDDSDVMSLRIDATNPARLFASACSGIYRSGNGAASWIKLQGIPYSSRRTPSIVEDPMDPQVWYAGTTEGLWVTRDAGETWSRTTPREWVINAVAVVSGPAASQLLLGTENQGVLVSPDAGLHFSPANAGFFHRMTAGFAGDPRDPERLLLRLARPQEALLESPDSGKTWHSLAPPAPAGTAEKLFATNSGWFVSLHGGGLARYDEATKKWQRFRFALPIPAAKTRHPTATPRNIPLRPAPQPDPQVFDLQVSEARVYVAASSGFWSGEIPGAILKHSSAVPNESLRSLEVLPGGAELWAVSATTLWHSLDAGGTWTVQTSISNSPFESPGPLLWVRSIPTPTGDALFLATQHGVYQSRLHSGDHGELLQHGLPGAAFGAPLITKNFFVLPMRNGGIYLSYDSGNTWSRLDGPREEGGFTGLGADGHGGFFAGSESEGLLHWHPPSAAIPNPDKQH